MCVFVCVRRERDTGTSAVAGRCAEATKRTPGRAQNSPGGEGSHQKCAEATERGAVQATSTNAEDTGWAAESTPGGSAVTGRCAEEHQKDTRSGSESTGSWKEATGNAQVDLVRG